MGVDDYKGADEIFGLTRQIWYGWDPETLAYWGWDCDAEDWVMIGDEEWTETEPEGFVTPEIQVHAEALTHSILDEVREEVAIPPSIDEDDRPMLYYNMDIKNYSWLGHVVSFDDDEQAYYISYMDVVYWLPANDSVLIASGDTTIYRPSNGLRGVEAIPDPFDEGQGEYEFYEEEDCEEETAPETPPAEEAKKADPLHEFKPMSVKRGMFSAFASDFMLLIGGCRAILKNGTHADSAMTKHVTKPWGDLAIGNGNKQFVEDLCLGKIDPKTHIHRLLTTTCNVPSWNCAQLLSMNLQLKDVNWQSCSTGPMQPLYDFGSIVVGSVGTAVTIQSFMNSVDPNGPRDLIYMPKYFSKVKDRDKDATVIRTQELMKRFKKEEGKIIGMQIIMIEGFRSIDKSLSVNDYVWRIAFEKGLMPDPIKSLPKSECVYYKNYQLFTDPPAGKLVHLFGGVNPGDVTNWHVEKCSA